MHYRPDHIVLQLMTLMGCEQHQARRVLRDITDMAATSTTDSRVTVVLVVSDIAAGHPVHHAIERRRPGTGWIVRLKDALAPRPTLDIRKK